MPLYEATGDGGTVAPVQNRIEQNRTVEQSRTEQNSTKEAEERMIKMNTGRNKKH